MRDIKFRVWFPEKKKMAYHVDLYCYENGHIYIEANYGDPTKSRKDEFVGERWNLMQFTGLKDKNGKDIYDGDIRLDGLVVKYWEEKAQFGWYKEPFGFITSSDFTEDDIEIIGNVHENPELIT